MDLPVSVEDPSPPVVQHWHDPPRRHISVYLQGSGAAGADKVFPRFVEELVKCLEKGKAVLTSDAWARLVLKGAPPDKISFEVIEKVDDLVFEHGISTMKLKVYNPIAQQAAQARDSEANSQGQGGDQRPCEGDIEVSSSPVDRLYSATDSTTTLEQPPFDASPGSGARLSPLPEAVKISKRANSASNKTCKLSSQEPLVIAHSNAFENNKKQPRTASSIPLLHPSIPGLDGEIEGVSKSTNCLRARLLQEPIIQGPFGSASVVNVNVNAKARKKRSRLEFEIAPVVSHENASAGSYELLGPDSRLARPLPRKVRSERLLPNEDNSIHENATAGSYEPLGPDIRLARPLPQKVRSERWLPDADTTICAVTCTAPSLEHVGCLLQDVTGDALVVEQEEIRPDISDWTQNKDEEGEAEGDGLNGHDSDEANDAPTASSAPSMVISKPPIPVPPRIWAQSRQEVCESLAYFRAYHSGVYSNDDIVKGYLLGAYAASRDKFHHNGKLIISHGGGKTESIIDPFTKRYQTGQDQKASDRSVRALLRTCKERRPLVLLADDKYALFPYDLASGNYTYVVLGLYWISHAWAECQSTRDGSRRIVRWKFAFQWCEDQGDPWWASRQEPPMSISSTCPSNGSSHLASTSGNLNAECDSCQEKSPFIYKQGWMCLNPLCDIFWTINGKEPNDLDYRDEFLYPLPQKFEILPNIIPARVGETTSGVTTTVSFSRGWHCMKCGRLSCRYKWEHWECANCGLKHVVNGRVRLPKEFWHQYPNKEFFHSRIGKDSGIVACRLKPIDLGANKTPGYFGCLTFVLPHDRGKIHLILGTPLSNGDVDDVFQLYQRQASTGELKFRRYPLTIHRTRGLLLANYFSHNAGEPYQYVGGTGNSVPFDEAPDCIRRALMIIKERVSNALRRDIPFNEILSVAYMERQKMSFHSDSEKGLGPVVASLSMGSTALMYFRPRATAMENSELKGKGTYSLSLVLRHGDVLIMDGDGVQDYYEHTVVPMNFRIVVTARCIGSHDA